MKILLNIIFYLFGVAFPLLIIFVAIFKKSRIKRKNIIDKTIKAVIIFIIFYIVKVGGITLMTKQYEKDNSTNEESVNVNNNYSSTYEIITDENGLTYVDGILIVNKTYTLPKNYVPKDTYQKIKDETQCEFCLNKKVYKKYNEMYADATSLGLNIWIQSGYRSYKYQKKLYNNYVKEDGKEEADKYSARAGHSEHQTGLAFDLNSVDDDFANTDEGKWVHNNCYKYGFILRYPKGKEEFTGYKYESWHLRYVGEELATKLYNGGDWITLEEYFNLKSEYNN